MNHGVVVSDRRLCRYSTTFRYAQRGLLFFGFRGLWRLAETVQRRTASQHIDRGGVGADVEIIHRVVTDRYAA
jgi:hypothetical protein